MPVIKPIPVAMGSEFSNPSAKPGASVADEYVSKGLVGIWYDDEKNALIVSDGTNRLSDITPIGPQYWKVIS